MKLSRFRENRNSIRLTTLAPLVIGLATALFLSSCGEEQYLASTRLLIQEDGINPKQATINRELESVLSAAGSILAENESIATDHVPSSAIINISVTATDPQSAADTCNKVVKTYVEKAGRNSSKVTRTVLELAIPPSGPVD